ncbi:MAG: histidine kinase [Actinomycetota bacterium]|nr:histidine kinase [Actinomycetota bacterium]
MELARVARPLREVLRVAFVVIVVAAAAVDLWLVGEVRTLDGTSLRPALLLIVATAGLGICWAMSPRHALPIAVAVATLSLVQTFETSHFGTRIGLFTEMTVIPVLLASVLSRRGVARWPVALLLVVAAESVSLRADDGPIRAIIAMAMLVLLGAAVSAVVYTRLRESERRAGIATARQSERLELARELHDVVGHHVTGIVVLAQANNFTQREGPPSAADRALAEIETAGLETLTSVRRLIGLLRTEPSTSSGARLIDIEQIIAGLRGTHPSTELHVDDRLRTHWVPDDLAPTVLRLVQEAATNVRRHGDPRAAVQFALTDDGHTVRVTVTNTMLHPTVGDGFGLLGMRERVDALHGVVRAGPMGDGRWRLHVELPHRTRVS